MCEYLEVTIITDTHLYISLPCWLMSDEVAVVIRYRNWPTVVDL